MQRRHGIDGNPQDETCTNIDSCGTANNSSPSKEIRSPTPVPLFLVRRMVSAGTSSTSSSMRTATGREGFTVWLDDDDDDSGCNQGCKEIERGENQIFESKSENKENLEYIKNRDPESCTTPPGTVGCLVWGAVNPARPLPGVLDPGEFERV